MKKLVTKCFSDLWKGLYVGRTIPSFRVALEQEINSWKHYQKALSKTSRQILQQVFNSARNYVSASSAAVRPFRFEGLFIGSIFSHEKKLIEIASEIEQLRMKVKNSG